MQYIHSEGYTFGLQKQFYDEYSAVSYSFISLKKDFPCVNITIEKKVATVNLLQHHKSCSLSEKSLEKSSGTVYMFKTALVYILDECPDVKYFEIEDKAHIPFADFKSLITPKRLLEGRKGWYEEHFGGVPATKFTKRVVEFIRNPANIEKIKSRVPSKPMMWWTAENIMKIWLHILGDSKHILYPHLISTAWKVKPTTIRKYNIEYSLGKLVTGGALTRMQNKIKAAHVSQPLLLSFYGKYNYV